MPGMNTAFINNCRLTWSKHAVDSKGCVWRPVGQSRDRGRFLLQHRAMQDAQENPEAPGRYQHDQP